MTDAISFALLRCGAGVSTSLNSAMASFEVSCARLPCVSIAVHGVFMLPFSLPSQARLSSVRDLQHWTWRLHCCFAGTGHQHVLDLLWNTFGVFWIICTCLCICASFTMFRPGNGTGCASSVFCNVCVGRYSGIASLLARQRSCSCSAALKLQ